MLKSSGIPPVSNTGYAGRDQGDGNPTLRQEQHLPPPGPVRSNGEAVIASFRSDFGRMVPSDLGLELQKQAKWLQVLIRDCEKRLREAAPEAREEQEAPDTVCVPSVLHLPVKEAATALQQAGLRLVGIQRAASETVRSGLIVTQTPRPGTAVPPSSGVVVAVSRGLPFRTGQHQGPSSFRPYAPSADSSHPHGGSSPSRRRLHLDRLPGYLDTGREYYVYQEDPIPPSGSSQPE